jgi:DNA-binding GntR family transcriptional regulator
MRRSPAPWTSPSDVLQRRVDSHLGRLLRRLETQVRGDAYIDYAAYLEADRAFHSAIVALVGNRRLSALYDEINLPLWLVRAQQEAGLAQDRDAAASLAGHRAILRALESRDPRRAAKATAAHIHFAEMRLQAWTWLEDEPTTDHTREGSS